VRRAMRWVRDRQETDGSWGGIQPPWVYSLLALAVTGAPPDDPAMVRGLAGLEAFVVREPPTADPGPDVVVRRLEACQSPVWDTALALTALRDAGVPADDATVTRGADYLLGEEITLRGDWAVRRPGLAAGGWAFEFANDHYPDVDDTAEVVLALRRAAVSPAARNAAIERGLAWVVGMASRDGGWAAFDADNTSLQPALLPFCDFGAVTDPPSADVTAHVVEALAADGRGASEACRRGVQWLRDAQEESGSWFGRWGANHVYGTGAAVPALVAAGVPPSDPAIRRAVGWLERTQQADGGWGEDLRSYRDPAWIGRGTPTASQTAWALLGLLAAGERDGAPVRRGLQWLVDRQRPDGTWDEPQFTGTGFPGDFYINYHLYRLVFPISALGRYLGNST
jgi:squalene-hopene/tetraprenyl-beta-curcumene cyclase